MNKTPKNLNNGLLNEIKKIILNYKTPEKIVIFGSRAGMDFKETSDIDIAIFGHDWTERDINIVKDRIEEYVRTPLKFDIVNFYGITKKSLKENILKGKIIYDSGKN